MTWRNTAFDAPRVHLLVDPPWLLAPLFVRGRVPPDLLPAWSRWWSAAVEFRPGGPAPRQEDLVAFSPGLAKRWQDSRVTFDEWVAGRPTVPRTGAAVEQELLSTFATRFGRPAAPRTLTVLVVPSGGALFLRPEPGRLVVDAELRLTGERYRALLDPVLADYF